ncbi:MAG: hypothetical protein M3Q58_14135 [Bacteroidota bacterium]|nr:hypothetical protein [Bacteroidota bacterium]
MSNFLIFITLFSLLVSPQSTTIKEISRIEIKANSITTDNLGNVYLLKKEEVRKYDKNGVFQNNFSDKSLGKITSVDATNFLKLLLFYGDFSKIAFLDNMLAPTRSPIHLQNMNLDQAIIAASSHNNGIWIFEQVSFQAIRLDQNLNISHQTGNLMQLLDIPLKPNFMMETNNMLYINNPETGILLFDIYGTYYKTIPIKELDSFQVIENKIFYFQNKEFRSYNLKTLEESKIDFPDQSPLQVRFEKKRIYVLNPDHLIIYAMD